MCVCVCVCVTLRMCVYMCVYVCARVCMGCRLGVRRVTLCYISISCVVFTVIISTIYLTYTQIMTTHAIHILITGSSLLSKLIHLTK
jgi:hypothetical protein